MEFTDSKWDLIQTGGGFVFTKTSDTPHIWSPVDNTDDAAYTGSYVNEENTPCLNIAKRDDGKYDILIVITGATVPFTDSTWEYLENGAFFECEKSSDIPNMN